MIDQAIDPKLLQELMKLTGAMIWVSFGGILAFVGFAIKLIWGVSKAHHTMIEMQKDLNGYGGRTRKVEESNNLIKERIIKIETTIDHLEESKNAGRQRA